MWWLNYEYNHLCYHHEANEKAAHTDEEEEEFTTVSLEEEVGVHVGYGCHESLQTNKLKKRTRCNDSVLFLMQYCPEELD